MGIKPGLRGLGLALSVAAAFVAVTAAPAQAGHLDGVCESGEVCFYDNTRLTGSKSDFYYNLSDYAGWTFVNSPYSLNDNIESGKSYASWMSVQFYEDANYAGSWDFLLPGQQKDWFPNHFINARASSHEWV